MSEANCRTAADRKKRVQTLKKLIILSLLIAVLVPFILCIILFGKVKHLNQKLDALTLQMEQLLQESGEQRRLLEERLYLAETESGVSTADSADAEAVSAISEELLQPEETEAAHKVYLTFDDGPSANTEKILDILDRYDVKATFFVVGKENEASKEALQMIADRGHSLGMHSYSHKYAEIYDSEEAFGEDFSKIKDYIYEVTGTYSNLYRFPGGSSNTVSKLPMEGFAEYLQEQEVRFFDWNVSSGDGGRKLLDVNTLTENCIEGITKRKESVILLHDSVDKSTTVEALPMIIENLLAIEDTVILPITEDTEPVQHIQIMNE